MLPRLWLPRLCSPVSAPPPPTPPHGAELWGAESLQSPTLTGPSARGSSNVLLLQYLYIWGKKPHLLPCGSISFTLTMRSLVFGAKFVSLLCSYVVNFHFLCPKSASVLSSCYSCIFELEIVHSLNFLITIDLICLKQRCGAWIRRFYVSTSYKEVSRSLLKSSR